MMMGDMAGYSRGMPPASMFGSQMHLKAMKCLAVLKERFERQYTWIDEALIEAKKTFASPEIQMIPKTPSAKRCRKVAQRLEEVDEDDAFEEAPSNKRARATKKPTRTRGGKSSSQEVCSISSEASMDTETDSQEARPSRSAKTRGAKKATTGSGRPTRNTRKKTEETTDEETGPVMSLQIVTEDSPRVETSRSPVKTSRRSSVVNRSARRSLRLSRQECDNSPASRQEVVCIIDSDSDDFETPQAKRRSIMKERSPNVVPEQTIEVEAVVSPAPVPSPMGDSSNKPQHFLKLNVKQRASQYEDLVRRSGSKENSPMGRLTPKPNRLCMQSVTPSSGVRGSSPRTPNTLVARPAVSRSAVTLQSNSDLGSSPKHTVLKVKSALAANAKRRSSQGSRRSSRRVSGSKLNLSKRRSSRQRYEERNSRGSPAPAVSAHMLEIKARQGINTSNASAVLSSEDEPIAHNSPPVRSTRSKARKQQPSRAETRTPEPPARSKLCLNKTGRQPGASVTSSTSSEDMPANGHGTPPLRTTRSKLRQNKPAPAVVEQDSDDADIHSGYRKVEPPSTSAPVRSTRSKMRKFVEQNSASSPCVVTKCREEPAMKSKRVARNARSDEGADQDTSTPPRMEVPIHANSFLNNLNKKSRMTPNNMNTTVTSFLQRNTPTKKPSTKEIHEHKRKQLLMKEKQEEDRLQARQNMLQKKAEEQRKKREERQNLAAKRRQEQVKKDQEMKKGLNQKLEEKKMLTAKLQEEKMRDDREKQKLREKKMAEAELRRKQEEEVRLQKFQEMEADQQRMKELQQRKKEFEEQERQKRINEQRKQQEERAAELERERKKEEERKRANEEQRKKEDMLARQEREEREKKERAERDRQEMEKQRDRLRQKEIELEKQRLLEKSRVEEEKRELESKRLALEEERRLQKLIVSHNNALQQNTSLNQQNTAKPMPKPQLNASSSADKKQLNTTYEANASTSEDNPDSYQITPVRKVYKPASAENYNIQELKSDDSTDDEEAPRKKIPAWATGPQLKAAIISQYYRPPDLDKIFTPIDAPDLCKLFQKKKAKFFKRTSSAVWSSPIYLPSGKVQEDHK